MNSSKKQILLLPAMEIGKQSGESLNIGLLETRLQAEAVILEVNARACNGCRSGQAMDEEIEQHL
jgi:hypothetical protein